MLHSTYVCDVCKKRQAVLRVSRLVAPTDERELRSSVQLVMQSHDKPTWEDICRPCLFEKFDGIERPISEIAQPLEVNSV